MARKYNEYLNVNADFIPVFSAHSDRDFPEKWKAFYPHESFKAIIKQMIDTLEMSSTEKNKSLWMSGAYGTGKTYASFVIKHLLEDDLENVKAYCESNNMMDIYARISGIRSKGKTLVVHRSSSASIIGNNRLFNCIIESVKKALKANGYTKFGATSQYDKVLATLKDENAPFVFAKAFVKYKSRFTEFSKPESVIQTLEDADIEDTSELLETIVEVAEQEGYIWTTSETEIIDWLEEVIKINNLYSIVFIWDEFTEFFKNNRNSITGLQEIAQASASIRFYFFLITHGNAQIITDLSARKVIEARFKQSNIEMADATAFTLMSQAIKHNGDLVNEWETTEAELWHRVEHSVKNHILKVSVDTKESELRKLLPLHPYAAYLLKFIAKDISSNQRTMFQFLSGDYDEGGIIKTNFRWFIDNYGNAQNEWNFLTADYIWSYFFTDDNVDLDANFKSVLSHYNNYEAICENDESKKRVLKVALLLTGMQQKSGATRSSGQSSLLRPTLSNISATFIGTPIENKIANIMAEFVSKGVFSSIQESNDTLYVPPVGNIDEDKFNEILETVKKDIPFEKIVTDTNYSIYDNFIPKEHLQYRYELYCVTTQNYKDYIDRANALKPNKIPLFFLFAKNEMEQGKVKDSVQKIFAACIKKCLVVDFSGQVFTDLNYDGFIRSKAEEKYYSASTTQQNHCKIAQTNAKKIIDEWKSKLFVTSLDVYTDIEHVQKCQGGGNLRKIMKETNSAYFGCGLEDISVNEKLFAASGYKETVAQMGMSKLVIPPNFSYLNNISGKLVNEGIWNDKNYVQTHPTHVVSLIKQKITTIIEDGFSKNHRVEIVSIWEELQKPPFGLLPCTGTVFLLGFLLKEYADSIYYKYDGANTVGLNYTDLCDLIVSMVKELPKAKNQYIIKQRPQDEEFCAITGDIFKIAKNKQTSIDDIAKNINIFLRTNEYPLWCLTPYVENVCDDSPIQTEELTAVALLCEFISTDKKAGRDSTRVAEDLYKLYKQTPMLAEELTKLVSVENMREGMNYYIAVYKPQLITITQRLGIKPSTYLYELNKKLSDDASYLWDKGDIEHQIDNLYADYYYIDCINLILQEKKSTIQDAQDALINKLKIVKIPLCYVLEERQDLQVLFDVFMAIKANAIGDRLERGKIIARDAGIFNSFFNGQLDLFRIIVQKNVDSTIVEDEVDSIFQNVPSETLFKAADEFIISMTNYLKRYRQDKKVNQLKDLWKKKTNSDTAIELSTKLEFPILVAFTDENAIAEEVFGIVNGSRAARETTIDDCLSFVKSSKLDKLFDEKNRENLFRDYFCGDYSYLITDLNDFKNALFRRLNCPIYEWIIKVREIKDFVKIYAEDIYKNKTVNTVKEKIKGMKQEAIAEYLMKLIEDKPLVGIEILKDEE